VERAHAYNGDPAKPLFIGTLRVFGSYLSPGVDPLGDVDIELTYGRRITDQKALSDYTKATGRSFGTYFDQLMWPQTELVRLLKKRSAFINITLEDITRISGTFDTIYSIDEDRARSRPRPTEPSSEGEKCQ
jgi:hypothetical protein